MEKLPQFNSNLYIPGWLTKTTSVARGERVSLKCKCATTVIYDSMAHLAATVVPGLSLSCFSSGSCHDSDSILITPEWCTPPFTTLTQGCSQGLSVSEVQTCAVNELEKMCWMGEQQTQEKMIRAIITLVSVASFTSVDLQMHSLFQCIFI